MPNDPTHTWIYVSVMPDGLFWPPRDAAVNTLNFSRVPGRWLNDTEFQTNDGDVMVIPSAGPDGSREGAIEWRPSPKINVEL